MSRTENWNQNPDEALDRVLNEIRVDEPSPEVVAQSRARVWARLAEAGAASAPILSSEPAIESCAGFQALFPEYRNGTLSPARHMLVEDHLHECVACRKAFERSKVVSMPAAPAVTPKRTQRFWMPSKWAVAAMLMLGLGLGSWRFWEWFGSSPAGSRARVLSADGGIYRVQGNQLTPVAAGAEFNEGVILRTSGGSHASVQLIDGSTVEVGERAEFSVAATRRDTTITLDRGQLIVQAAKRSSGHLYVNAGDSRVAVTGTIFSVNRGLAGSRVSVVEGEVHVEHGRSDDVLHSGDQVATHSSLARTSVPDEISWSRNYDQYLALLRQFAAIRGKLSEVHMPGLRYASRLLDSVPDGTTILVSLPNLSSAIRDLQRIVNDQARQSPELQSWLQTQMPEFEKITGQMSRVGDYVGDEILFASQPCKGFCGVVIAEVTRPGLKEYLDSELAKVGNNTPLHHSFNVRYAGNKVIIGEQDAFLNSAAQGGTHFAQSELGQTVSTIYRRGAGMFVAADLETILQQERGGLEPSEHNQVSLMGFNNVRHLIAEQREINGKGEYSAVVTFRGEREGVASWIAAPGSMGSLDFISPGAQFAASFVVKQPAQMLEDMLRLAEGRQMHNAEFEQMFGISMQQLASYLGGEVTVAVDGPLVPIPAWKFVAEVKDPQGLQSLLQKLIATGNDKLRQSSQPEITLKQEVINGRTYFSLRSPFAQVPMEIHYTWVDGYLLAGSSQGQLDRALRDRAAGTTLSRSQDFRKLLPHNQQANFSGIVYQNAGDVIRLFTPAAGAASPNVTPEQQKQMDELAASMDSTLICLYGQNDRIEIAGQGGPASLLLHGFAARLLQPGQAAANSPARLREHRIARQRTGK